MATRSPAPPFDVPRRAVNSVAAYLAQLEPERITTGQATELFALFAELTRLGSAGQVLLTPRVAQSDAWKNEGHRSAASWVAKTTGTGLGDAIATLETAQRLQSLPRTTEALRTGVLSAPQVREIAAAAVGRPSAELRLIEAATTSTLKGLKERCREIRAVTGSAQAENDRYEAVRRARYFRHWSDADGAFRGEFKLTPDAGARMLSSLEMRANDLFDAARKADHREPPTAYAADALVDLVTQGRATAGARERNGRTTRASTVVHVRVDATALRRGHVEDGEVCEIAGVGPVPVATARALLPEAFLKVVVTDGVDVLSVSHLGRAVSAHVRTAIEERDPTCVVPGCDVAMGLEIDHWQTDFGHKGPTELANLARLCHFHHAMKTHRGFTLGGGPGKWEWDPPPALDSG